MAAVCWSAECVHPCGIRHQRFPGHQPNLGPGARVLLGTNVDFHIEVTAPGLIDEMLSQIGGAPGILPSRVNEEPACIKARSSRGAWGSNVLLEPGIGQPSGGHCVVVVGAYICSRIAIRRLR